MGDDGACDQLGKVDHERSVLQEVILLYLTPVGSTDLCINCGGEYIVASGRQMYCSHCAAQAVNQTVKKHKRQYAADHKDKMAKYKAAMTSDRHVCIICGEVFDSDLPVVTCSTACDKI